MEPCLRAAAGTLQYQHGDFAPGQQKVRNGGCGEDRGWALHQGSCPNLVWVQKLMDLHLTLTPDAKHAWQLALVALRWVNNTDRVEGQRRRG